MNPGLLDTRLIHDRRSAARGTDGSVSTAWDELGSTWARRMRPRGGGSTGETTKDQERRMIVFRVRSQPFLSRYQNGDRFRETAANNLPSAVWRIDGWSEAEGTRGAYVDVTCEAWTQ